jgi:long-chain acyl-CoA synthetase
MKNYPLNDVPYFTRFCDMIDGFASLYGDSPALSWFTRKQEKQTVSFNQLREDVYHLQAEMIRRGLAGKHLAIVSENSYEWLLVYFAATYCGSVAICVDIEQSEETILQMLQTADTDAVFLSSAYRDICSKYAGDTVPSGADEYRLNSSRGVKVRTSPSSKTRRCVPAPSTSFLLSRIFTSNTA